MSVECDVRAARDEDAEAVSEVIQSALRETNARDYAPEIIARLERAFAADAVRTLMRRRTMLVAACGHEIVGTASLDGEVVRTVFVRPDRQGTGIGRRLIMEVIAMARDAGARTLRVPSSVTAEGFYARFGFQPVHDAYHGDERTIVMECRLGPDKGRPMASS